MLGLFLFPLAKFANPVNISSSLRLFSGNQPLPVFLKDSINQLSIQVVPASRNGATFSIHSTHRQ